MSVDPCPVGSTTHIIYALHSSLYTQKCSLSVRPHQVSHRVTTFDALLRNILYRFLQRCASSSDFFIRSLQMSDAFYKSSFFLNNLTLLYRGARRNFLRGGMKFWEKYFALTKVQATLFTITLMSYMLFQF